MKHKKRVRKLGRTSQHNRCMAANFIKSLLVHGRVTTTLAKAKKLRSEVEKIVTYAGKHDAVLAWRYAQKHLMLRFNPLTKKERELAKEGDYAAWNTDRQAIHALLHKWAPKYATRPGGYTRIKRFGARRGDAADQCRLEFVDTVSQPQEESQEA